MCSPSCSSASALEVAKTIAALCFVLGQGVYETASAQQLPEGNSGIAASHPNDAGIGLDPAVIFADDFESYGSAAGLTGRWDQAYHDTNLRIATSKRYGSDREAFDHFAAVAPVGLRVTTHWMRK